MADADIDFELKIGRIGAQERGALGPLQGDVGRARGTGAKRSGATTGRAGATRGAGKIAGKSGVRAHQRPGSGAWSKGFSGRNRRVVVKARIVAHAAGAAGALSAHVAYLAREQGQTRAGSDRIERQIDYLARAEAGEEGRFVFYDADREVGDARALTNAWRGDARHFRLILSPEDGDGLGDLKPFVRELMGDLSQRLGTRLEWIGLDHWDTDNPHSHVLIRGRRADGRDLVIPRQIISHEIRERAQTIVTRALGPRPELAIAQDRAREIGARDFTGLDRELLARARDHVVAPIEGRSDLVARLDRLSAWGLVEVRTDGAYALGASLRTDLEAMRERRDVMGLLERVEGLAHGEFDVLAADQTKPATGRLVQVGQIDELSERMVAVIEDGHGRLLYSAFDRQDDQAAFLGAVPGAIVAFAPREVALRPADDAIARIARLDRGLYSVSRHLELDRSADAGLAAANERRLEAMRRAGFIARDKDGVFVIPDDYAARALAYEARIARANPVVGRVLSYWTLTEQAQAFAATHLDRVLAGEARAPDGAGPFARQMREAILARRGFLAAQGLMEPGEVRLSQGSLATLQRAELDAIAHRLAGELGRPVRTDLAGPIEGVYARRIDLAQGRVALLWSADAARLVPWRPALERFAGRPVAGRVRARGLGQGVSISWGLKRGLARAVDLPPM